MKEIALIDDDAIIRRGLEHGIDWQARGYALRGSYHDGEEALKAFRREGPPDGAIVDIKMPFMDGLQFSREALALWPDLKIVLISGFKEFEYARKALRLGVANYVLKPIDREELLRALREALREPAPSGKAPVPPGEDEEEFSSPVERALAHIREHYRDPDLDLNATAGAAHVSPSHLSRLIKRQTGQGFTRAVKNIRLETARILLRNSPKPVYLIAEEVGFSDAQYFSSEFKKAYGVTPQQYRNRPESSADEEGR